MLTTNTQEHEKNEVTLAIDDFDKPEELTGVAAWTSLMTNLLFMTPGTYPTQPNMGIGLETYEYQFADEVIWKLKNDIIDQQLAYLPDIPLSSVEVSMVYAGGAKCLLIKLAFDVDDGISISTIAANTSSRILDFDVSW